MTYREFFSHVVDVVEGVEQRSWSSEDSVPSSCPATSSPPAGVTTPTAIYAETWAG